MFSNNQPALASTEVYANARWVQGQAYIHGQYSAVVSPCVWMYPNYHFQLTVESPYGQFTLLDRALIGPTAVVGDIFRLLAQVAIVPCQKGCGQMALDPSTVDTNRAGECEACFIAKINAEFVKANAKEQRAAKNRDRRQKANGMTHKVEAWIHAGGDDQKAVFYLNYQPTEAQIKAMLRKQGSRVLDDYRVELL